MTVTDWFSKRYKPRYNGLYEVESTHWPWSFFCEWTKGIGWANNVDVVQWRGLTEPYEPTT